MSSIDISQVPQAIMTDQAAQAMLNRGIKAYRAGDAKQAWELYQAVLKKHPNHPVALNFSGELAQRMEKSELAEKLYRQAVAVLPNYIAAYYNLAELLKKEERMQEAENTYRHLIKLAPKESKAWESLGLIQEADGRKKKAEQSFRKAVHLGGAENPNAYRYLARGGYSLNPTDIKNMLAIAERKHSNPKVAVSTNFALAFEFERKGEIKRAFKHFELANDGYRSTYADYDFSDLKSKFLQRQDYLIKALESSPKAVGATSEVPIFILGMPRSGTTLVEQIIATHPDVFGAGESMALTHTTQEAGYRKHVPFPQCLELCQADDFAELGEFYLQRVGRKAPQGVKRITDKMPDNYRILGMIPLCLPNAKIIHITRHPMDTCVSMYRSYFEDGMRYAYRLEELGQMYLLYRGIMEKWKKALPGKIYEVNYETLVQNFEVEAKKLISHVGLAWDERCLEFHKNKRVVHTTSSMQVKQPIYSSSINAWKRYEEHLEPLKRILAEIL